VLPVPPSGFAIYRLDGIKSNVPPDFEKNKASIKKNYVQTISATKLQEELKKLKATNIVKWDAPGWDVLYNWYQATIADNSFGTKSLADQNKVQMDFFEKGAASDGEPGKLAAAGAIDPIWTAATEKQKKELEPKYLEVLTAILESNGSFQGDLLMAKLAANEKKGDLVFQGLLQAAQLNENAVTLPSGPENFSDLAELIDKYTVAKLLTDDQVKQLQSAMDEFRSEEKQYEQSLRDNAKQAAAAAEESKKEAAAAAAKAKADAKKAPVKLTPGGGPLAPHPAAPGAPAPTGPAAAAPAKPTANVSGGGPIKKITIQQPPKK
jgi:chemotaxis protein histidine kinase CheA